MAEAPNPTRDSNTTKAPKDKECEYCHQPFTSSSLGRHLDQFIKPKNPKAPDGIHNVEEIRKLRGSITRRHPKGTLARRDTSASAWSKKSSVSDPDSPSTFKSPVSTKVLGAGSTIGRTFPFNTPWTATGVKNDIPNIEHGPQKETIRQPTQTQYHENKRDLEDKAKAAELALLELIGSLRVARQHMDIKSMPFDVNPLSLDFPALVLRFLDEPGTLFASIQTPTSTSWSIEPPWTDQLNSLKSYFTEAIKKRKSTLAEALRAVGRELTCPPSEGPIRRDAKEQLLQVEKTLSALECELSGHLDNTFRIWSDLRLEDRERYWKLELARGVSRNRTQVDELKQTQHFLRQEIGKLRSQIQQLEHLQQPREFKIMHPSTVQFSSEFVRFLAEDNAAHPRDGAGLLLADQSLDLETVVSKYIARWKEAVLSSRSPEAVSSRQQLDGRVHPSGQEEASRTDSANVVTAQEQRQPQTSFQHQAQGKNESQCDTISPAQPFSNDGSADTNQEVDEDASDDDGDNDGEADADADADGDEDEDVDSEVDVDADADAEMDGASAYNGMTTSSEGLSHSQEHVISPQHQSQHQNQHHPHPSAEIPSHTQQHILSSQQHHGHGQAMQTGALRTRSTLSQGRFNPYPSNKSPIRMSNQSVSANNMAAPFQSSGDGGSTGGLVHNPQYHFASSRVGQGQGQGQHMGRVPETIGRRTNQAIRRTNEPMYAIDPSGFSGN